MEFCQSHWDELRKAVDDRGMGHLIAQSGEEAVEDAVAQISNTDTIRNWDPLMSAHWAIAGKVMERVGLSALAPGFCPLCAVQQSYEVWPEETRPPEALDASGWINDCMDAMLVHARKNNLVPEVQ